MKKRSRADSGPIKRTGRKTPGPKRRNAPNAISFNSSITSNDREVARLTHELNEAREQQAATADVLKVISRSTFELQTVLETLVASAASLCAADKSAIWQREGELLRLWATDAVMPEAVQYATKHPLAVGRSNAAGRAALEGGVVHISDALADREYQATNLRDAAGYRTVLAVPLLRGGVVIGVFALTRQEVKPFGEKQIELVTTFADQAVIAIENTRLINELRQSLEQQTATADVLKVISGSLGALQPIFRALLENATQLCRASYGNLWLYDGDGFRSVALHGPLPPSYVKRWGPGGTLFRPEPGVPLAEVAKTKKPFQIPDIRTTRLYRDGSPLAVSAVNEAGMLAVVAVPMMKEYELIGAIAIYSKEARPFSDKQIELLQNFAAQAVIAIENARLLDELRQRTDDLSKRTTDLTETLEQQTATAKVLEVISRSAFELKAVFEAVVESSVRLCGAERGVIYRFDGETLRMASSCNAPPQLVEWIEQNPIRPGADRTSGRATARAALTRQTVHIPDVAADPIYNSGGIAIDPARTFLAVPILKADELLGVITIYQLEVRPFTDRQISLVETFADQAAIAIENVRLLDELRKRTEDVEKLNEHLEQRVTDQVNEIERIGRLRRFLPPQVADLIVASGSEKQLESHRREITALFCDLRGFTGFTESADAEDVMALLRDYHAAIGQSIIKYDGTLERYAGDGVMVVFNDPVPVDNSALQAVLMALELREAIGKLTGKWRRFGHDIGFGIGIAHGYATLGTIGFEGRFDYAAIGTVSNVASRLCDEAKPGQILISPRVLVAVEDAVQIEPVGEFELKGIRRPLAAYNVVGAVSAALEAPEVGPKRPDAPQ